MVKVFMTVPCVLLGNTVWRSPFMRQVTAALDITVPPTSLMVSPACVLVPMAQNKFAAPREHTLMKQEGGLRQTVVNVLLGITVQLDLRHPQFV